MVARNIIKLNQTYFF